MFMPRPPQRRGAVVFDHPALIVMAATSEHMLAMKAKAARPTDRGDIVLRLSSTRRTTGNMNQLWQALGAI